MPDNAAVLDIPAWIDSRRLGRLQTVVVSLCGLAVLLDGFDAQVIGFVAPAIIRDWQLSPSALTRVFSSALFGILVGCLFLAPIADWLGRRVVMLSSILLFGVASIATAWVQSVDQLILLRFVTGIGLGACMPNALALTSEYAPARVRARLTSWMFTGFSLGAFAGGMLVARFVPVYGWRGMFLVGGVLPLVLFVAMLVLLPESVRYLAAHGGSTERVARILRRIDRGAVFATGTRFVMSEPRQPGLTVLHLFREGRTAGTLLLWAMFFLMLVDVFLLASWTPTVLHLSGLSVSAAVVATAMQQAGSVTATIALGPLFDKFGFYRCLVPLLLAAAIAVIIMGNGGSDLVVVNVAAFVAGAGVMGGQTSLIVLAGSFYPTFIRATGVGWGLGIGRIGAIIGPLLGGLMVYAQWGPEQIFLSASIPAALTAVLLLVMVRVAHVSPAGRSAVVPA